MGHVLRALQASRIALVALFAVALFNCGDRPVSPGGSTLHGDAGTATDDDTPNASCDDLAEPMCAQSCEGDVSWPAVCTRGTWQCPPGMKDVTHCLGECLHQRPTCVTACGSTEPVEPICLLSQWECPHPAVPAGDCPSACAATTTLCCDGTLPVCDASTGKAACAPDSAPDPETGQCEFACPPAPPPDPDQPSTQAVRFQFGRAAFGWLVTAGASCSPVAIERLDDSGGATALTLGIAPQIACEGPIPPAPGPTQLLDLGAPAGMAANAPVTWDAREGVTRQDCVACTQIGVPDHATITNIAFRPAGAGRYRATFAVFSSLLSAGCQAGPDATATCTNRAAHEPSYAALCGNGGDAPAMSVEFDLPASGDIDVMVP